jgi:hypothetical protein
MPGRRSTADDGDMLISESDHHHDPAFATPGFASNKRNVSSTGSDIRGMGATPTAAVSSASNSLYGTEEEEGEEDNNGSDDESRKSNKKTRKSFVTSAASTSSSSSSSSLKKRNTVRASRQHYEDVVPGEEDARVSETTAAEYGLMSIVSDRNTTRIEAADGRGPGGNYTAPGDASWALPADPYQDNDKIAQLEPFFGLPTGRVAKNPYENYSREDYQLPDAFTGPRDYNRAIIFNSILEDESWYLKKALKFKQITDMSEVVLTRFIFDDHLLTRVPYESVPNLVTSRRETVRFGFIRQGLGQQLEHDFYKTKEGQFRWAMGHEQIHAAVVETLCLGVIVELLGCKKVSNDDMASRNKPKAEDDFKDALRREVEQFDAINKSRKGIAITADLALELMQERSVRVNANRTLYILCKGAARHARFETAIEPYAQTGVAQKLGPRTMTPRIDGFDGECQESRAFRTGRGKRIDPMFRNTTIGSKYHTGFARANRPYYDDLDKFQTSQLNIRVYQAKYDEVRPVTYKDMFQHNSVYHTRTDPDIPAGLTDLGEKLLKEYCAKGQRPLGHIPKVGEWYRRAKGEKDMFEEVYKGFVARIQALKNNDGLDKFIAALDVVTGKQTIGAVGTITRDGSERKVRSDASGVEIKDSSLYRMLEDTSLKTDAFFHFCMDNNIPIFHPHLIFVPHMCWRAGTCILMIPGDGTGNVYIGHADYSVGYNSKTKVHTGAFTVHAQPKVVNGENVVLMRNVFVDKYIGGDDGRWFKPEHREKYRDKRFETRDPAPSMFSIMLPPDVSSTAEANLKEIMDISGQFSAKLCQRNGRDQDPHYPTAHWYANFWGWKPKEDLETSDQQMRQETNRLHPHRQTIVFQGLQFMYNPAKNEFSDVICNKGHLGENLDSGHCKRKRTTMDIIPVPAWKQPNNLYQIVC